MPRVNSPDSYIPSDYSEHSINSQNTPSPLSYTPSFHWKQDHTPDNKALLLEHLERHGRDSGFFYSPQAAEAGGDLYSISYIHNKQPWTLQFDVGPNASRQQEIRTVRLFHQDREEVSVNTAEYALQLARQTSNLPKAPLNRGEAMATARIQSSSRHPGSAPEVARGQPARPLSPDSSRVVNSMLREAYRTKKPFPPDKVTDTVNLVRTPEGQRKFGGNGGEWLRTEQTIPLQPAPYTRQDVRAAWEVQQRRPGPSDASGSGTRAGRTPDAHTSHHPYRIDPSVDPRAALSRYVNRPRPAGDPVVAHAEEGSISTVSLQGGSDHTRASGSRSAAPRKIGRPLGHKSFVVNKVLHTDLIKKAKDTYQKFLRKLFARLEEKNTDIDEVLQLPDAEGYPAISRWINEIGESDQDRRKMTQGLNQVKGMSIPMYEEFHLAQVSHVVMMVKAADRLKRNKWSNRRLDDTCALLRYFEGLGLTWDDVMPGGVEGDTAKLVGFIQSGLALGELPEEIGYSLLMCLKVDITDSL